MKKELNGKRIGGIKNDKNNKNNNLCNFGRDTHNSVDSCIVGMFRNFARIN